MPPRNSIAYYLTHVKTASVLFGVMAVLIFLGTYLPQEPLVGRQSLIDRYGSSYEIMKTLGLTDIFHSWWFLAVFLLLSVCLILVSFLKVFPRAKKGIYWSSFLTEESIARLPQSIEKYQIPLDHWERLIEKLKREHWQVKIQANSLVARRGAYHRLGASIVHVGIITVILGACLSLALGFNGVIQGVPGERFLVSDRENSPRSFILTKTARIFHAPLWFGFSPEFEVEITDTDRVNYADGSPKQWSTGLIFLNNRGEILQRSKTEVNAQANFQGVDFYQADWDRVLWLNFNDQNFELRLDRVQKLGEIAHIEVSKGLSLLFWLPEKDSTRLKLISLVGMPDSTALQDPLRLFKSGGLKLLAELTPGEMTQIGPMKFVYRGAFSKTGIQFKSSPGDLLMLIGMIILTVGVLIAFGAKRQIWAVKSAGKVLLIGNSDRSKLDFKNYLAKFAHDLNAA
ncbi:MAG: cytochrome c biogenesis protein ResB [Candidatus Caenarcaniphilales bacterium]|nr:cytochrome c biogenesis protein ResB [Candidatus Caenarcaniphilales bacterium]